MNVTLIGMPGSGKSSVGRILAQRLGCAFLDVDPLIAAAHAASSLQQVLDSLGNEGFLDLGPVVYLKLPCQVLEKRLWNLSSRGVPLAPGQTLQELYALRVPLYEKYADVTVNADRPKAADTARKIIQVLEL